MPSARLPTGVKPIEEHIDRYHCAVDYDGCTIQAIDPYSWAVRNSGPTYIPWWITLLGTQSRVYYGTGTYYFDVPSGVTTLYISGVAAGGGCGSKDSGNRYVSGNSGEAKLNQPIGVTPGEELTIEIGAPGAGSISGAGDDADDTTITNSDPTTLITLAGGPGGASGTGPLSGAGSLFQAEGQVYKDRSVLQSAGNIFCQGTVCTGSLSSNDNPAPAMCGCGGNIGKNSPSTNGAGGQGLIIINW